MTATGLSEVVVVGALVATAMDEVVAIYSLSEKDERLTGAFPGGMLGRGVSETNRGN